MKLSLVRMYRKNIVFVFWYYQASTAGLVYSSRISVDAPKQMTITHVLPLSWQNRILVRKVFTFWLRQKNRQTAW